MSIRSEALSTLFVDKTTVAGYPEKRSNFWSSVRALFHKIWLVKLRNPGALVEIFLALCIFQIVYIPLYYSKTVRDGELNPGVSYTNLVNENLIKFFAINIDPPAIVCQPDTQNVHSLMDPIINRLKKNLTLRISYVNSSEEMSTFIYELDSSGLGVYWVNANDPNAWLSPNIQIFYQNLLFMNPGLSMYQIIRASLANQTHHISIALMNVSHQNFATPTIVDYKQIRFPSSFFSVLPVMLSTMDDIQVILNEKTSKLAALFFLAGCPESAYWFVLFIDSLALSIPPYIIMGVTFCLFYLLVGTSLSLFITISLLFIVSHVIFQFFLTTFFRSAKAGRNLTVTVLVFIFFSIILNIFVTLDEANTSLLLKQVANIVPFSAYELAIITMYSQCRNSLPPLSWTNSYDGVYDLKWTIYWLIGDSVLYLALFVLFNATNSREFGSPLLPWKDLLRCRFPKKVEFNRDSPTLIEVNNLGKTYLGYKTVKALSDVNFDIRVGEVIVMIGPNGAGKSTLINALSGTIEPTSGSLKLFGEDAKFRDTQSILGICFQENVIVERLTIREHFVLFGNFRKMSSSEVEEFSDQFSKSLQLDKMLDNRANDLSGGQKRKLSICLCLIGKPPLVIMDEPAAGVDVESRQTIWKTIASLKGTTTIVTSHALEEAEAVSSRLFIVAGGKLVFTGTSTELRKQFKCGYLLRIEGSRPDTLALSADFARKFVNDAHIVEDKPDTIAMGVSDSIPEFLENFEKIKAEIGVVKYSFSVEQLEDMLMKLIQTEEAQFQGRTE